MNQTTTPLDRFRSINQQQAGKAEADSRHSDVLRALGANQQTTLQVAHSLIQYLEHHTGKTEVVNQLREIGTPDALKVVEAVNQLHTTLKTHKDTDLSEITAVMKSVLAEAKAIPKDHAKIEIPKSVEVSNLVDNTDDFKHLLEAVKAIKLVAEAPQVHVPAPNVQVDAPDLSPIDKGLQAVRKAVEGIVMPEIPTTDLSKLEKLQEKANKLLKEISEIQAGFSMSMSASGGRATPYENMAGIPIFPNVVESIDYPGTWGVIMLNPDGSSIGTGGGTSEPPTESNQYGTARYDTTGIYA